MQDDLPALTRLLRQSHLMAPEDLPRLVDEAARRLGAGGCRIYLVSRDQRSLLPIGHGHGHGHGHDQDDGDELGLDGTVAGRAFRTTEIVVSAEGARLWVPLVDGTERLGVLEVLIDGPDTADAVREPVLAFAVLVAELVVSKGQYTDTFERVRRALPMGVPAEMLWRQLPPLTFATGRFVVTAQLEPWHEVGGDAFDYSIDGGLH
jgi:hypothetical protein